MLNIAALFTSFFLMISAFFAGLPNAVNAWDKPTETVTDTAKVLALYQNLAAKNTGTKFLEKIAAGDLVDGRDDYFAKVAKNWGKAGMFFINPRFFEVKSGVPGSPKALLASDIRNAKAQYYHKGKTVEITFDLAQQVDKSDGTSNTKAVTRGIGDISKMEIDSLKVQVQKLGYTLKSATVTYKDAKIMIRANVADGKIVKASFTYTAVASASRVETDMVFQQTFDYTRKL